MSGHTSSMNIPMPKSPERDNADRPIKVGSVVALKSGGGAMVVNDMNDGKCECVWRDDAGQIQRAMLNVTSLVSY